MSMPSGPMAFATDSHLPVCMRARLYVRRVRACAFSAEVIQQLARKIKEEGGRNGNSQEGQLDEMLLFCITQFLGELALIVSDHTLYRQHKLIGLNKELSKMTKVMMVIVLFVLSCMPRHMSCV